MLNRDTSNFVKVLWILIGFVGIITAIFLAIIKLGQSDMLIIALIGLVIVLILLVVYIIFMIVITKTILNKKSVNASILVLYSKSIRTIYPIMSLLCDKLHIDKDSVRRVFSDINNHIVLLHTEPMKSEDILILTPHCIQLNTCTHKVTGEINNCKMCGGCNVDPLLRLSKKYDVKLIVVTGGTLARKLIKDIRPKGIIAIACERDLTHGILDVKQIPVIGIKNDRPNGPCINTKVDIEKVEEAINYFLGGNKWR